MLPDDVAYIAEQRRRADERRNPTPKPTHADVAIKRLQEEAAQRYAMIERIRSHTPEQCAADKHVLDNVATGHHGGMVTWCCVCNREWYGRD